MLIQAAGNNNWLGWVITLVLIGAIVLGADLGGTVFAAPERSEPETEAMRQARQHQEAMNQLEREAKLQAMAQAQARADQALAQKERENEVWLAAMEQGLPLVFLALAVAIIGLGLGLGIFLAGRGIAHMQDRGGPAGGAGEAEIGDLRWLRRA